MNLKDRVAIVTGAARGIGRGIAISLAQQGVHLALADITHTTELVQELAQTASLAEVLGVRTLQLKCDVTQMPQIQQMVARTLAQFGQIDILVNNAGVISVAPVVDLTEEEWDRVLNVNLKGVFLCCKAVAPHMMERRSGRIVNIASVAGKRGSPRLAHYCASKFGVVGLTQVLALELAPYDITVNAVCPGVIRTYMWTQVLSPGRADLLGVPAEQIFDETIRRTTPLGREQTPEDVGQCVVYLCQADNVTGIAVNVAGGSEMR